jgi:alpha-mannosidase
VQEIDLYNDIPRIDFRTQLFGFPGQDGILSAVFPLRNGKEVQFRWETHNAVTERPDGMYYAQTFVDGARAGNGVAFLNRGTGGVATDEGVIRLILLRSITNYAGYYTPLAAERGSHSFEYSLYAHSGDWRNDVLKQSHSFTSPLFPYAVPPHPGALPAAHSFVSINEGKFEVTAFKRSEDGKAWILRGHETNGQRGRVRLTFDRPVRDVWMSDLTEKPLRAVSLTKGTLQFPCEPFEFVTFRLDANK